MKINSRPAIVLSFLVLGIGIYAGSVWRDRNERITGSRKSMALVAPSDVVARLPDPSAPMLTSQNNGDDPGLAERELLRQELTRVQNRLDELIEFQASLQVSVDDVLSGSGSDDSTPISDYDQSQHFEDAIEQQQNAIDTRLYQEEVDQEWTLETERALNGVLASEALQGFELVSSSCGSTLCKVELSIDPNISPEVAMQKLSHHRSWDGPSFVKLDENGLAQIYFAREGHELPTIDTDTAY
jgi:hypothetical protein